MIIAQISDTHLDPDNPDAGNRIVDLERCVDDINRLDRLPDVVIHTGDLAHNGTSEKYQLAARILGALSCPVHISPGNRDDRDVIRSHFPAECHDLQGAPFIQYSVDSHEVRLIAIDTLSPITNMGDFCEIRADSLRRVLAEEPTKPTAIFMHHPPFEITQSKYRWQFDSHGAIELLEQVLEGQGQVVRVFCGHAHRDATGLIAGVPSSCVPSVAVDLRLGEFPDLPATAPVYQIHRFDADQGFVSQIRSAR